MTYEIALIEYETNKPLGGIKMDVIPRVGEFLILDEVIGDDWKNKFYIVRSVTYTTNTSVYLHIEKKDIDAMLREEELLKEKVLNLKKRFSTKDIEVTKDGI